MNSKRILRTSRSVTAHVFVFARYGAPINRWKHYYANDDGVFDEDFTFIELKKMPQPFPKEDFTYSHKGLPPMNYPLHKDDIRYNFQPDNWPRRHFVPDFQIKMGNFNDFDEMMHGIQWTDFDLEYQLADPMESNHYIQGRPPIVGFLVFLVLFLYCVIYPLWGYGIADHFEDPFRFRKKLYPAQAAFKFTWINDFYGHNYGIPLKNANDERLPLNWDKDGNPLPKKIRRYDFADEYTYRI